MTTLRELLKRVPVGQRPMALDPARADTGRIDELGNPVLRDLLGREYTFDVGQGPREQPAPRMPRLETTLDAQGRATHNRVPDEMPRGVGGVNAIAQAIAQGLTAPRRAAQGDSMTLGDVWATALDYGGMTSPMRAPAGALRSGATRTAADAAETPAQEVARFLRKGRAADVTDDMMARVDPQEMHRLYESGATGRAMPMDEASRMGRAREMGFDTDAYHGTVTGEQFQAFGQSPHSRRSETYLAPDRHRDYANSYAAGDQGRVLPLRVNRAGFHDGRTAKGREELKEIALDRDFYPELLHNHLRGEPDTLRPVTWGDQRSLDELSKTGYPGAIVEERPWMDSMAVFDPTRIRSRFARFDPRLSHLANLSAAGAGAVPLGAILSQQDPETQQRKLREYLEGIQ